ncbi:GAL4-like Zn(II)2Cys6 (or C6 zinc) binuclear cluster DNA-binding domain [Teratosphaeria destructans]|uniref:GAL4-like Zn(II)2Cys6 (Or C6 zinc) binuclear cluster DNA-binding domain n=1 Tax=Teratosphaeria destructans TaxID=418781 RepID=A0A9W7SIF1_9PEZI|nr:GAL4-like Zn(II)2Cys6 (or C6 zinc) binuclear cluster DNA-binding domain [Teratosphaeria destructans]
MSDRLNHCDTLRAGDSTTVRGQKRKHDTLLDTRGQHWLAYPSPPMSVPPSPAPSSAVDLPAITTIASEPAGSVASRATTFHPTTAFSPAAAQPASLPSILSNLQAPGHATGNVLSTPGPQNVTAATQRTPAVFATPQLASLPQHGHSVPTTAGPSASRGSRRSKAHVASACINCKRAHLSCDVQRPCTRCVAAGKQDTCIDVQHKKRGRPRLRDEAEFKVEQMTPQRSAQASVHVGPIQQSARPIATTRPRRGDSFRSLQSVASDDSTSYAGSASGYGATLQSPFTSHFPPPQGAPRSTFEVATALLDMDLVVIRANRPFNNIMLRGQSTQGLHISEIAAPADHESFMAIRNRLRAEREARDPAYMPPIQLPGQDPIQGIPESEADQFVDGFSDVTYRWSQITLGPGNETFPARVRLAKASTYFVVVTLPSFQPVEQQIPALQGPLMVGPPLPTAERFITPREPASQSAPSYVFQYARPPPAPIPTTPSDPFAISVPAAYPIPSRAQMPFQQQQAQQGPFAPRPITPPRLPIAEPPTDTTAFTPRSAPRQVVMQPPAPGGLQLPPIISSPVAATPAAQRVAGSSVQRASSSEDEREGRPRRKQRMGIDDVLHR